MKPALSTKALTVFNRIHLFAVMSFYQLKDPCRMYRGARPKEVGVKCYLCADRGGWPRCNRSRRLAEPQKQPVSNTQHD